MYGCGCTCILGDSQSVQLRDATTTTAFLFFLLLFFGLPPSASCLLLVLLLLGSAMGSVAAGIKVPPGWEPGAIKGSVFLSLD